MESTDVAGGTSTKRPAAQVLEGILEAGHDLMLDNVANDSLGSVSEKDVKHFERI